MSQSKIIYLLVDDDSDDRSLFEEALNSIDHEIICYQAEDGQQALKILNENPDNLPNVIFLDINMPVMSGWECLKSLKSDSRYKNIPVIMYSTSSHQRDVEIATDLGALCFCVKPENFKKIQHILQVVTVSIPHDLLEGIRLLNKELSCQFKGV